jgi:HK97 family phage major capsid protein
MPNVNEYETEDEWMAACVPVRIEEGNEQEQAVAACLNIWRERSGKSLGSPDTVVAYGGAIKTLDDGRIGGYLVRFSDPTSPDLEGDYFDATTDFGIEPGAKTRVYFNHRLPVRTKEGKSISVKHPIGWGTLTPDDYGVLVEAVLDEREQYEQFLDRLGWSSGTASHLIDVEPVGKANHITYWPLGLDASLTPTPAEPRNAVVPLKALAQDAAETETQTEPREGIVVEGEAGDGPPAEDNQTKSTEVEMSETTVDEAALISGIVNGLDGVLADSMIKAMQAYADKQAEATKARAMSVEDALDKLEGTKSFGDWLIAVRNRDNKRLKEVYGSTKVMVEQTGAEGGYLVPTEYLNDMVEAPEPFVEVVQPRARVIRGSRRSIQIPVLDQTGAFAAAGKPNYWGGLLSYWTEEAAGKTTTEPDFKQLELVAHKLAGYTQASDELLADSAIGLDQMLRGLFAGAVRWRRDYAYLRGTGVGQPLGVINSGALLTTARDVANQISANDIHSLLQIFMPSSMGHAVWVISQTCMEQIAALGDGTNYIWAPNAQEPLPMRLYGIPVIWTEKLPALGTTGDILLADFNYYYIYERGGLAIDVSQHYAFTSDLTTWRFVYRTDGQPSLSAPIYIDNANQISPFVALLDTTD